MSKKTENDLLEGLKETLETSNEVKEEGFLPVIPLRDIVVCPRTLTTIFMSRSSSVKAAEESVTKHDSKVMLLTQLDRAIDEPTANDFWPVGITAEIDQLIRLPDGSLKVLVRGIQRCKPVELQLHDGFYRAKADFIQTEHTDENEENAFRRTLIRELQEYALNVRKMSHEFLQPVIEESDFEVLCDTAASLVNLSVEERIKFIAEPVLKARCELLINGLERELENSKYERRIQQRIKGQMEKNQREYYLNEQMKAIRKELGLDPEGGDEEDDVRLLERRVVEAKLPEEVEKVALNEIRRMRAMPPSSSESSVVRGYIETLLDVPWNKKAKVSTNIAKAQKILDDDHWGLEKVKERILEYLAVQKRVGKVKSPILCLVGGPGVGKTSLGRSIAHATGRPYVRMALGGVNDEAEIRGHRRTYIGAMPGSVIKHMIKGGVRNPLFLLDEIDKLGASHRGDPAAALLEVLDPEQNNAFEDHYLEVPYDLSDVLFVATSNSYNIPPALLDRMEVISLSGYTEDEKTHIALRHLVPKQLAANGTTAKEVQVTESAIHEIIRYYTRESGVRGLERAIGKILRKVVLTEFEGVSEAPVNEKPTKKKKADAVAAATTATEEVTQTKAKAKKRVKKIVVTDKEVEKYLGVRKYTITFAHREPQVGQVNGLSWSEVGGDILTIEALQFPGKGAVVRTGMLGDVMKESVEAARSVVRARAPSLGLKYSVFNETDWHIHFPEGAIPKDGPSAGCAIVTAMVSALTGIAVRSDVAMTGEITLRGEVIPIGGLKEKLLAAQRGGIKTVLIPHDNAKDLTEIKKDAIDGLEIITVRHIEEVLARALVKMPEPISVEEAMKKSTSQTPSSEHAS